MNVSNSTAITGIQSDIQDRETDSLLTVALIKPRGLIRGGRGMVNQNPTQNFDQATQPNRISRGTSPTAANTDSSADQRSRSHPNRQ
jgi:hypothetical protein